MQIESGIAIPEKDRTKINWSGMEVGDSFIHGFNAAQAGNYWAERNGLEWRFSGKRTKEQKGKPYRIWRVA